MKFLGKVIGGTIGLIVGGPIGAGIGTGIGSLFDGDDKENNLEDTETLKTKEYRKQGGDEKNTKPSYNTPEYDKDGYNREGYDKDGYDREGHDKDGYDREGFKNIRITDSKISISADSRITLLDRLYFKQYNEDRLNLYKDTTDFYKRTVHVATMKNLQILKLDTMDISKLFFVINYIEPIEDDKGQVKAIGRIYRRGYNKDGYDKNGYNKDGYNKQFDFNKHEIKERIKAKLEMNHNQLKNYTILEEYVENLLSPYIIKKAIDIKIQRIREREVAVRKYQDLKFKSQKQYNLILKVLTQDYSYFTNRENDKEFKALFTDNIFIICLILTKGKIISYIQDKLINNDIWQQIMIKLKYDELILVPSKYTKVTWMGKGVLNYLESDLEHLQELSIMINPLSIQYFKNPSFELQYLSVYQEINNIRLISKPDVKIQKLAIDEDSSNIKIINEPDVRIQKLAIEDNVNNINFIKKPSIEVQLLWLDKANKYNQGDFGWIKGVNNIAPQVKAAYLKSNYYNNYYDEYDEYGTSDSNEYDDRDCDTYYNEYSTYYDYDYDYETDYEHDFEIDYEYDSEIDYHDYDQGGFSDYYDPSKDIDL